MGCICRAVSLMANALWIALLRNFQHILRSFPFRLSSLSVLPSVQSVSQSLCTTAVDDFHVYWSVDIFIYFRGASVYFDWLRASPRVRAQRTAYKIIAKIICKPHLSLSPLSLRHSLPSSVLLSKLIKLWANVIPMCAVCTHIRYCHIVNSPL